MSEATVVDIRPIPPRERHPLIFQTFDDLSPGGAIALINDHDPKPLLYQLQFERGNRFEWWPLEEGPEVWRILITKREDQGARTVTDFLQTDHRRLDGLWEEYQRGLRSGNLAEAQTRFAEFALGLRRHIRMEENVLFPAFEERSGMRGMGPTAVMRSEHREIQALLEGIMGALAGAGDSAAAPRAVQEQAEALYALLQSHDDKEESVLYPMSDRMLGERERDDLVREMQAS